MPSQTIILLAALGPLREALYRASQGLENGHVVQIVCFRKDLYELLSPLVESGVKLELWPEGLLTYLGRPFRMAADLIHFQNSLKNTWGNSSGANVFAYGTSICLPIILATAFLARKNTVYYNGVYEGRGAADGIFYDRTKSVFRRWKARFLSLLVGTPLECCRDWSPVFVLPQDYVDAHFLPADTWDAGVESRLEKLVIRESTAELLVLFSNHADYYRNDKADMAAAEDTWNQIANVLREVSSHFKIAVKPHPSCSRIPASWQWMEILPPGFPVELLRFPNLRVVLGDASTGMVDLAVRRNVPIVSFADLYTTTWGGEIREYLECRVDPQKAVKRAQTIEGLSAILNPLASSRIPGTINSP